MSVNEGRRRRSRVAALVIASREIEKVHALMSRNPRYAALALRAGETGSRRLAARVVRAAGVRRPFWILMNEQGIGVRFRVYGHSISFFLNFE